MRFIEYFLETVRELSEAKNQQPIFVIGMEEMPYFDIDGPGIIKHAYMSCLKHIRIFDQNVYIVETDDLNALLLQNQLNLQSTFPNQKPILFLSRVTEHFRHLLKTLTRLHQNGFDEIIHIVPDMYDSCEKIISHNSAKQYLDFKTIFYNFEIFGGEDDVVNYHATYTSHNIIENIFKQFLKIVDIEHVIIDGSPHIKFVSHFFEDMSKVAQQYQIEYGDNRAEIVVNDSDRYIHQLAFDDWDEAFDFISKNPKRTYTFKNLLSQTDMVNIPFVLWELSKRCTIDTKLYFQENNCPVIINELENCLDPQKYFNLCRRLYGSLGSFINHEKEKRIHRSFINTKLLAILLQQEKLYKPISAQDFNLLEDDQYITVGCMVRTK